MRKASQKQGKSPGIFSLRKWGGQKALPLERKRNNSLDIGNLSPMREKIPLSRRWGEPLHSTNEESWEIKEGARRSRGGIQVQTSLNAKGGWDSIGGGKLRKKRRGAASLSKQRKEILLSFLIGE